jgi:glycosyltransferase involved in cell wall biosynthesis
VATELEAELGWPAERITTVPLGVPAVAPADPGRGRELAGGSYVLSLGTVEPRKNLPSLVRAFDAVAAELDDVRLVIAGGDGWGAVALDETVTRAQHRARIVRLGYVDAGDRAALLRGAELLAYPSVYEGFGFPPLEAMSVGVPVVATDGGSLPEVVGDAAAVVPVGDDDALAGALLRVLGDSVRRATLVERGRAHAASFTWERCVGDLVTLYRALRDRR